MGNATIEGGKKYGTCKGGSCVLRDVPNTWPMYGTWEASVATENSLYVVWIEAIIERKSEHNVGVCVNFFVKRLSSLL